MNKEKEISEDTGITLLAYPELGIEEEIITKEELKIYKSEEEVVKEICNLLEQNLLKNMMDTTDFRELMEKIAIEFSKRYPKKKSKLITL